MKTSKNIVLLSLLALFLTAGMCKSTEVVPGGWIDQKTDAEIVVKALNFLKKEAKNNIADIEILEVISAQTQVVAGYNVALKCKYKSKEKVASNLKAVIYIDLKDKYTLINLGFEVPKKQVAPE